MNYFFFSIIVVLMVMVVGSAAEADVVDTEEACITSADGDFSTCQNPQIRSSSEDSTRQKEEEEEKQFTQKCKDLHENCAEWAERGECDHNPKYMLSNCPISCDSCPMTMPEYIPTTFGKTQILEPDKTMFGVEEMRRHIEEQKLYMEEILALPNTTDAMREGCINQNRRCTKWALQGECDANPRCKSI
jgi:hypothetical protein